MCKIKVKTNLYYANICKHEHEKNDKVMLQDHVLKLVLNILKKMKGLTSIYTPLGTQFKEASKEASMCASNKEAS